MGKNSSKVNPDWEHDSDSILVTHNTGKEEESEADDENIDIESKGTFYNWFRNIFRYSADEEEDFTADEESSLISIDQTFVNPMKSILHNASSGAFVPWSHISKVIAALSIIREELNANDAQMNEIMIRQCIQLLKESPYTLKLDKNENTNKQNATQNLTLEEKILRVKNDTLSDMQAMPYGKSVIVVNSWISKLVNAHFDDSINEESDGSTSSLIFDDSDDDYDPDPKTEARKKKKRKSAKLTSLLLTKEGISIISDEITQLLQSLKTWNFDIFEYYNKCGDMSVSILGIHILKNSGILDLLQINVKILSQFLHTIQQNYRTEIAYHNATHASDVCATLYSFMNSRRFSNNHRKYEHNRYTCKLRDVLRFRSDEILTVYIACLCHDVGHPGLNNAFQINSESELASLYNDVSVLENFHISTSYKILKMSGNNFVENSKIDSKRMRKLMTNLILHTDMFYHNKVVAVMQTLSETKIKTQSVSVMEEIASKMDLENKPPMGQLIKDRAKDDLPVLSEQPTELEKKIMLNNKLFSNSSNINNNQQRKSAMSLYDENFNVEENVVEHEWIEKERHEFLCALVHACDISNPCKNMELMSAWTERIQDEFYKQGDKERKLGIKISDMCDRRNPKKEAAAVGFGNFIVKPLFTAIQPFFSVCDLALEQLDTNTQYWKKEGIINTGSL